MRVSGKAVEVKNFVLRLTFFQPGVRYLTGHLQNTCSLDLALLQENEGLICFL